MTILNLTQHTATQDQIAAGVVELDQSLVSGVRDLLTFNELPTAALMQQRATAIVAAVELHSSLTNQEIKTVMLGGAPFFMATLQNTFKENGYQCVYAFSVRQSVEHMGENGEVVKQNVFKHVGFVEV